MSLTLHTLPSHFIYDELVNPSPDAFVVDGLYTNRVLCIHLSAVDNHRSSSSLSPSAALSRSCPSTSSKDVLGYNNNYRYSTCTGPTLGAKASDGSATADQASSAREYVRDANTVSADMDEQGAGVAGSGSTDGDVIHGTTLKPTTTAASTSLWIVDSMYSQLVSRLIWTWASLMNTWGIKAAWIAVDRLFCMVGICVRCFMPFMFFRILRWTG